MSLIWRRDVFRTRGGGRKSSCAELHEQHSAGGDQDKQPNPEPRGAQSWSKEGRGRGTTER